jgi:hypothetical protein
MQSIVNWRHSTDAAMLSVITLSVLMQSVLILIVIILTLYWDNAIV